MHTEGHKNSVLQELGLSSEAQGSCTSSLWAHLHSTDACCWVWVQNAAAEQLCRAPESHRAPTEPQTCCIFRALRTHIGVGAAGDHQPYRNPTDPRYTEKPTSLPLSTAALHPLGAGVLNILAQHLAPVITWAAHTAGAHPAHPRAEPIPSPLWGEPVFLALFLPAQR